MLLYFIIQLTDIHLGGGYKNADKPEKMGRAWERSRKVDWSVFPSIGLPGGSDLGSIPGSRSPGGGHGNPLQCSCLENPMDRGAWGAAVCGVTKSLTWLSDSHFHSPSISDRNIWMPFEETKNTVFSAFSLKNLLRTSCSVNKYFWVNSITWLFRPPLCGRPIIYLTNSLTLGNLIISELLLILGNIVLNALITKYFCTSSVSWGLSNIT